MIALPIRRGRSRLPNESSRNGQVMNLLMSFCSQNVSAVERVPLVIALPPGVGALDFYIDLAIDCVETTNVTMPCQVRCSIDCLSPSKSDVACLLMADGRGHQHPPMWRLQSAPDAVDNCEAHHVRKDASRAWF